MSYWHIPFFGSGYFFGRPKLWLAPLLTTLIILAIIIFSFSAFSYYFWPPTNLSMTMYALGMLVALAKSAFLVLIFWVFITPIVLNFGFEAMIRAIFREEGSLISNSSLFHAALQSIRLIFLNIAWRLFWPIFIFISIFVFPILSVFLTQIAIGHLAVLDAASLALTLQGRAKKEQKRIFKKEGVPLFLAGLVAGFVSFFILPTVILWLFWIPGVYCGSALYVIKNYSST